MKTIVNAIFAVGLLAAPAVALAAPREDVSLKVSAAGVDFANPASIAEFRRAAERRIAEACNPGDRVNADMMPDFKCRAQMSANLEPTVQRLALRATEKHFATTD
jgi:UrcA family protein